MLNNNNFEVKFYNTINKIIIDTEMDVIAKINEAEIYHSMGLVNESLMVYNEIYSHADALDDAVQQDIASKISVLKNDIHHIENNSYNSVSEKELDFIKQALSVTDESPDIVNIADAFFELGLFKEALCEYGKLLCKDNKWKEIIPNTTTCLLKCFSSSEIHNRLNEIIKNNKIEQTRKSEIRTLIGKELEKRNLKTLAYKFYDSDLFLNTQNTINKKRPKSRLSFDLLLNIFASIFVSTILCLFIVHFLNICSILYFLFNLKPN